MSQELTKVRFTNLDKILYPELGITKAQVIEHYIRMAPRMLDILAGRPLSLTRFPDGVAKEGFYEKDVPVGTPEWVKTFRRHSESADRDIHYILCGNLDTLVWLANLAALELHMTLSRADSFDNPDFALIDIDPEPPLGYNDAVNVALLVKETLDALSLKCYVKTSGKKGLHILVPLAPGHNYRQTRDFVHQIGIHLAKESEIVVSEFPRSRDPGTVFIDYTQNSHGKTMVSPYSLRATPRATVSTPLEWDQIKEGLNPETFNILTVREIEANPWKMLPVEAQRLEVNRK